MEQNNSEKNIATEELWAGLFKSAALDNYFEQYQDFTNLPEFSDYIKQLCAEKEEKPERVIKRGGIEPSFGHRLFSGERKPSRDTVLQLAFGFQLDTAGTQQLLKIARATALHPRIKRDAVIAFCLHNHYSFIETQQILFERQLPLIGGKRHEKEYR